MCIHSSYINGEQRKTFCRFYRICENCLVRWRLRFFFLVDSFDFFAGNFVDDVVLLLFYIWNVVSCSVVAHTNEGDDELNHEKICECYEQATPSIAENISVDYILRLVQIWMKLLPQTIINGFGRM